jgi:predicted RNA binding protein YcfA (HicA-like mRNA interferase family)
MSFPPNNQKEWVKLLKKLGFEERRVGKGKHAFKFCHPRRKTKEIMFFDFSLEEIKTAAR